MTSPPAGNPARGLKFIHGSAFQMMTCGHNEDSAASIKERATVMPLQPPVAAHAEVAFSDYPGRIRQTAVYS